MTLGDFIKQYRADHGLSQRRFAELCNGKLTHSYIAALEKNSHPNSGKPIAPTFEKYKAIAEAMGMTFDELIHAIDGDSLIRPEDERKEESELVRQASDLYAQLSPENQALASDFLRMLLNKQ